MIVLCVHGASHHWERLQLVTDLAGLIHARPIDWGAVRARAERIGARRIVALGLRLGHELLAVELPAGAAWALAEAGVAALAAEVEPELLALTPAHLDEGAAARYRFLGAARERRRDCLRMLARLALEPRLADVEAVALPPRLAFLYPLVRLGRLTARAFTGC